MSKIKEKYEKLFHRIIERKDQAIAFKSFLEEQTSWLTSPASTRFHLCKEGGLFNHSIGVAYNALNIKSQLASDLSDESVIIAALFHDVGKIGLPGKPYYLRNTNPKEVKKGIFYKINPSIIKMNIAVRSLYMVSQHIKLSEEEAQAIVAHDGIYPINGGVNNLDYHHKECRLQMITHFADKWTAAVIEDGRT